MPWSREEDVIGDSAVMRALSARVARVATSSLPVLITGETGTGKELIARAIHTRSRRRNRPFVSENCAALSESLLEAELFGHEAGAFTGAKAARDGLFQRAHGGTLFIDEIGDMSPGMQAKLLRALQEGEVRRVGGQAAQKVDVRVLAATHKNLEQLVREGKFRQDLLFRLAVLEVHVPALRERIPDIPRLADHVLCEVADENGSKALSLTDAALEALIGYNWPGNVRELENAVRVAALFSNGEILDHTALPIGKQRIEGRTLEPDMSLSYSELLEDMEERERRYVVSTLEKARGNKAEAARRLGVTRYALYRTMRRLGISKDGEVIEQEPEAQPVAASSSRRDSRSSRRSTPSDRLEAIAV